MPLGRSDKWVLAGLLAAAFGIQANFVLRYPQPELFGDTAAYLRVGRDMTGGLERILGGKDIVSVFVAIRGGLYFFAAGAFFGLADRIRPNDATFLRLLLAAINTLGLMGAFFLARLMARGRSSAGFVAVVLGALHPSLATHLTRAYPDPLTGCLFVWAAVAFARAQRDQRLRDYFGSGLLLTAGLLVRPQILGPVLAVLIVLAVGVAVRRPSSRLSVLAVLSGCLPVALLWTGLNLAMHVTAERPGAEDEFAGRYGWTVFSANYPQGFWQYLDTDGWEGPYRLRQEPYFNELDAAARRDPRVMASQGRAYEFTLRYIWGRGLESILMVLDNAYRLFDRPVNGYRWDYPIPLEWQVRLHHLIVVMAAGAIALAGARSPALMPVFLVPVSLCILHGLTFPWPRYSQSAIFILLASAAWFGVTLADDFLSGRATRRLPLLLLGVGLVLHPIAAVLSSHRPEVARWLDVLGVSLILASPFLAVVPARSRARDWVAPGLCCALLLPMWLAHSMRSVDWHETRQPVGGTVPLVEQRITLSERGASSLRRAREAFIVFDLLAPDGEVSDLSIEVNGRRVSGSALIPTMPRLSESTSTGSRDPRTYRQWWALPLSREIISEVAGEIRIRLEVPSRRRSITLFGDRHAREQRLYEGPSFGDWPTTVALKIEYDGDYRIPVRRGLESESTQSLIGDGARVMTQASGVYRIRIVTLASDEGFMSFSGERPARTGGAVAMGFFAHSGSRGQADLTLGGDPASFRVPLGAREGRSETSDSWRLCYRPWGVRGGSPYAGFVLSTEGWKGTDAPRFDVSFQSGMSVEPMFFSVNLRADARELQSLFDACQVPKETERVQGAVRTIDGSRNSYPDDTGKWRVAAVF